MDDQRAGHLCSHRGVRTLPGEEISADVIEETISFLQDLFSEPSRLWAAGYNVVTIPVAAGVLAPVGILLSPAVGAILMSLSTIVVALNAQLPGV